MSEEKETKHNVIVRLLSKDPITHTAAVFTLAKSINIDDLDEEDIIILGYDFGDISPGEQPPIQPDRKPSKAAQKIRDIASRSPGALGDLYAFMKGYKWHQIYIGFAAVVLIGTLLFKWAIRLITGNFI